MERAQIANQITLTKLEALLLSVFLCPMPISKGVGSTNYDIYPFLRFLTPISHSNGLQAFLK